MKLFINNERKITKDKNSENVPHSKITGVVLIHCNIINNDYKQDPRVLYIFAPSNSFGQLLTFHLKILHFLRHSI